MVKKYNFSNQKELVFVEETNNIPNGRHGWGAEAFIPFKAHIMWLVIIA